MNAAPQLSLGDLLGSALRVAAYEEQRRVDERAQYLTALELARRIAPVLRVGEVEVFEVLCTVPDAMLPLLRTPEGWMALAALTANELGADFPVLTVTLH